MHSHLAIIGKNGELALKPDQSITITDKNPMFNDQEMFSQPIPLPFDLNRHVLKNMDDVNSTMRSGDVQGERFQFVLDGIPFRNTAIKIQEGTKLDGTIDVNFDATNRTFKDMIADLRCRDVEVQDEILIGEKIGDLQVVSKVRKKWDIDYFLWEYGHYDYPYLTGTIYALGEWQTIDATFQPPVLGFSYPAKCAGNWKNPTTETTITIDKTEIKKPVIDTSYINTSQPYPTAKYCNSRICYPHHDIEYEDSNGQRVPKEEDGSYVTSSDIIQSDKANPSNGYDFSPYWMLPADRPASGICFYVGYFLECLFKTLGVAYDMTALTSIEDFNYLCFFSTQCHYRTENTNQVFNGINFDEVNLWLSSRGCGGQINTQFDIKSTYIGDESGEEWIVPRSDIKEYSNAEVWGVDLLDLLGDPVKVPNYIELPSPHDNLSAEYTGVNIGYEYETTCVKACVQKMYATSDNFPNVNVSEVIESLENSFGVRFCYDGESNKVTVKLLKDMFRDQQPPIPFKGKVLRMVKMAENIRGIRMKYSAEEDVQEQQDYIRYQKRDYDTTYNYMEYPEDRTKIMPYSEMLNLIDIGNRNCYVDLNTGDAFRIKVNSEATTVVELKPSAFEVAGLKGVELGDCSKDAEDNDAIKEFVSNFEPVITNNLKNEKGNTLIVPFIDEDMDHECVKKIVQNAFSVGEDDYVYVNYELILTEAYDPSKTDDGQSPLMEHDWGLTIGILRPAVGGGGVYEYDRGYDGFGNSRWGIRSSDFCVSADSYDVFGRFLGTNNAGSFSLKPRAYKPFRYKYVSGQLKISTDPKQWDDTWLIPCNEDERDAQTGLITKRLRSRGMCDTWMIEFFRFLLNRQKYYVEALCTAAELADIPNKWLRRWEIDGKVGWINLMTYPVNTDTGLGKVEMEFFAL